MKIEKKKKNGKNQASIRMKIEKSLVPILKSPESLQNTLLLKIINLKFKIWLYCEFKLFIMCLFYYTDKVFYFSKINSW